ncbi:hypothetical protein EIP86_006623 [Pleurotus ostreatoroseus]|nr:hypothetical protein EIP86_006623 [Pleurotus ostreatoroseus]
MKFSAALVSLALTLAGVVDARMEHRRVGPSVTFTSVESAPTQVESTTSSSSAATTGKRGISYNNAAFTDAFGSKTTWAYDWDSSADGTIRSGLEFVPMLWGTTADHTNSWSANAQAAINAGATHLLAFNEPDLSSQANLTPAQAASAWMTYMQPFAGKAKLCSPAITNGAAPMGTAWLDEFLAACTSCTIDCIAIHIYDSATNTAYYQNYISGIGTKYGKPTWVTEFGAAGTTAQQQAFLQTMLPFLDNLSTVERYAYFMAGQDILVDDSGALTALGQTYNSV